MSTKRIYYVKSDKKMSNSTLNIVPKIRKIKH